MAVGKLPAPGACRVCGVPTCLCENECKCTNEQMCVSTASSVLHAVQGATTRNRPLPVSSSSLSENAAPTVPATATPAACASAALEASSTSSSASCCHPGDSKPLASPTQGKHQQPQQQQQPEEAELWTLHVDIDGMSCGACARTVHQSVLSQVAGVQAAHVNAATDTARIEWRPDHSNNNVQPPVDLIQDVIESVGYTVRDISVVPPPSQPNGGNGEACCCSSSESPPAAPLVVELAVRGMTCSNCARTIQSALENLEGVAEVSVSVATDSVRVRRGREGPTEEQLRASLEDVGYTVEAVEYPPEGGGSTGTPFAAAAASPSSNPVDSMQERWQRLTQRQQAKVQAKRRAFLWSLGGTLPILMLTMILPPIFQKLSMEHVSRFLEETYLTLLGGHTVALQALILWVLATPVQFGAGYEFYKMTYYNLRTGHAGMDVLVALGTTASYGYAAVGAWNHDAPATHFFETSAVLISFVLLGKWLQALAVRRTSQALTRLLQLQTKTAVVVRPVSKEIVPSELDPRTHPYQEVTVPIEQVQKGDLVKVVRGASIPADGRIKYGVMLVNESMVTGESMPVLKVHGADVLGGTVCVESSSGGPSSPTHEGAAVPTTLGAAFVEVTGVGSATALSQIIQLVQEAQTRAVPIQTFADSVSTIFVPTVCIISLLTYMVWYALCASHVVPAAWYGNLGESPTTFSLKFAIACLVISCPCALGLATPTAVMVGTGCSARVGVLMKGGEALEVASKVDTVIFDKTGTLTKGSPAISDFVRVDDEISQQRRSDEHLLWMLACLERTSEHPLAKAVVLYAEERLKANYLKQHPLIEPTNFEALTGRGASATVSGTTKISAGNRAFAQHVGLTVDMIAEEAMQELESEGKTAILVGVDNEVCLVLGLADQLKPGAADALAYLREVLKVDIWMVTGDNPRTAASIANTLGLPANRVVSEALPAAKVQEVMRLQGEDRIVAMVGDGINDSIALAQADVGISMGTGAEIAAEASDMVLTKGDVRDICTALHLSRAIFRRIQLNLLWSLSYNIMGIPLAAGAFYPIIRQRLPPTVAALAMALSSVSVVLSSLSLRWYRPPQISRSRRSQQQRRRQRRRNRGCQWIRRWKRRCRRLARSSRFLWTSGVDEPLLNDDLEEDDDEVVTTWDRMSTSEFTDTTAVTDNRSRNHRGREVQIPI